MRKLASIIFFMFAVVLVGNAQSAFPVEFKPELDLTSKDLNFKLKEDNLIVSMERPANPMKPFTIDFSFDKDNVATLTYSTNMQMNMGNYNFIPKSMGGGKYNITKVILPKCGSGKTMWYGKLDITYKSGAMESVYFFYDVK